MNRSLSVGSPGVEFMILSTDISADMKRIAKDKQTIKQKQHLPNIKSFLLIMNFVSVGLSMEKACLNRRKQKNQWKHSRPLSANSLHLLTFTYS